MITAVLQVVVITFRIEKDVQKSALPIQKTMRNCKASPKALFSGTLVAHLSPNTCNYLIVLPDAGSTHFSNIYSG